MAYKLSPFSENWHKVNKRKEAVKYAERRTKAGKATPHTVGVLRDEARRLEKKAGITGQPRVKSDRALKKMSKQELLDLAKQYQERIARARTLPPKKKTRPKTSPTAPSAPEPPQPETTPPEPEPQYGMPEKFGAWDDFKDWLADQGIILDPSDPLYRKMLEYSREIGDSGYFSQSEQFSMLCNFYISGADIEDL